MTAFATFRRFARFALLTLAGAGFSVGAAAQTRQTPAPIERRPPVPASTPKPRGGVNGQHLSSFFDQHSHQTQAERLKALENEPGFHDLPAATQQRMRNRMTQLDNMTPEKRERVISRTEAMERLTPDQRAQVRNSMQLLAGLPPASRRAVQRTFRAIRGMPPPQRLAYLNSPDIRSQFSEQERNTLASLMAVERYLPPSTVGEPPPQ